MQTWIDDNSKSIEAAQRAVCTAGEEPLRYPTARRALEPAKGQCQLRPMRVHVSVGLFETERTSPFT